MSIDKYWTLVKQIGTGSTSRVFEAYSKKRKEKVALKIADISNDHFEVPIMEGCVTRFIDDRNILSPTRIRFVSGNSPLLGPELEIATRLAVIEYPLFEEDLRMTSRVTKENLRDVLYQMVRALAVLEAHDILHGDVKPENFLVRLEEGGPRIVLCDWGLSQCGIKYRQSPIYGIYTQIYRPPEIERCEKYDQRADVWALGCTMYETYAWVMHERNVYTFDPRIVEEKGLDYDAFTGIPIDKDPLFEDLINSMICAEKRPYASQLLEHPFFKGGEPVSVSEIPNFVPTWGELKLPSDEIVKAAHQVCKEFGYSSQSTLLVLSLMERLLMLTGEASGSEYALWTLATVYIAGCLYERTIPNMETMKLDNCGEAVLYILETHDYKINIATPATYTENISEDIEETDRHLIWKIFSDPDFAKKVYLNA